MLDLSRSYRMIPILEALLLNIIWLVAALLICEIFLYPGDREYDSNVTESSRIQWL